MNFLEILEKIYETLKQPVMQWGIWTLASIVMMFTPDNIDRIIEGILALLGIKNLYDGAKNLTKQ